ncbi:MAG: hypothetical protein ABJK64_00075 [Paraglaciecola sp.]|uniref:tetratricopeptide repeat protein n=1 Tax=Paraglaciecola sp. TaxID=1920173 RepID=UPI00329A3B28
MPDKYSATRKRKRGVKASSIKLHKAMSSAGIKTQAALANLIADYEGIETPPKDMVSKVFREVSVSPLSIERIASVLKVDAYTLYLSQEQASPIATSPKINTSVIETPEVNNNEITSVNTSVVRTMSLLVAILTLIIGTVTFLDWNETDTSNVTPNVFSHIEPTLGKYSLVVSAPPHFNEYSSILMETLKEHFHVTSEIIEHIGENNPEQLNYTKNKLQTDFVLNLEFQKSGNFFSLSAKLHGNNHTHEVWNIFNRTDFFIQNQQAYFQDLTNALRYVTGIKLDYTSKYYEPIKTLAQQYYLEGRNLLDTSEDELNIKSAQSRFTLAISAFENFAEAHAGLCEALVHESWMGDEKALLEEAQLSCNKAMSLNASNYYVVSAYAFLLKRTGRSGEAVTLLNNFHQGNQPTFETLYSLANAEFELYKHEPNKTYLIENALNNINKAIIEAPELWKPYNALGLMEWTLRHPRRALVAFKEAVERDATELVVTNVGTLNLCMDNLEAAKQYFERSMNMVPNSHLGVGRMATLQYINRNYSESLLLRQKVLELIEGDGMSQMWGALADSYEKTGNIELAIDGYMQALNIIDRDKLRGNFTPYDQVSQIYYKAKLSNLDRTRFPANESNKQVQSEMMEMASDLDSGSISKLVLIALLNKNLSKAKELAEQAVAACPVYEHYPDFEFLFASNT